MPRLLLYHFGFNIIYIFSKKNVAQLKVVWKQKNVHANMLQVDRNTCATVVVTQEEAKKTLLKLRET